MKLPPVESKVPALKYVLVPLKLKYAGNELVDAELMLKAVTELLFPDMSLHTAGDPTKMLFLELLTRFSNNPLVTNPMLDGSTYRNCVLWLAPPLKLLHPLDPLDE